MYRNFSTLFVWRERKTLDFPIKITKKGFLALKIRHLAIYCLGENVFFFLRMFRDLWKILYFSETSAKWAAIYRIAQRRREKSLQVK